MSRPPMLIEDLILSVFDGPRSILAAGYGRTAKHIGDQIGADMFLVHKLLVAMRPRGVVRSCLFGQPINHRESVVTDKFFLIDLDEGTPR